VKVQRPHVWIDHGNQMLPKAGLLTEWRQTPLGEWEGRVVVLSGNAHNPGESITICWVKAEYLRPVAAGADY
jgi:hypothetical protein